MLLSIDVWSELIGGGTKAFQRDEINSRKAFGRQHIPIREKERKTDASLPARTTDLHLLLLGCFYVMAPLIDRLKEGPVLLSSTTSPHHRLTVCIR